LLQRIQTLFVTFHRDDKIAMIEELKLRNWRRFKDTTLYIDPMTIVIGVNASGKSNILDALLFLQRFASGVGIFFRG